MRMLVLAATLSAVAAPAAGQRAQSPSMESASAPKLAWGKPHVSFDLYRADAVECGKRGYYTDVSGTDAAKVFADGSRRIDNLLSTNNGIETAVSVARVVEGARPELRLREVAEVLQSELDDCLIERGYRRFALTEAQRKRMAALKVGTPARHAYLHSLASDPGVLAAQAVRTLRPSVQVLEDESR